MRFQIKNKWFDFRLIIGDNFRARAHAAFDPLWQDKYMSRNAAYKWLADQMGIPRSKCHFSLFTREECEKAIEFCNEFMRQE